MITYAYAHTAYAYLPPRNHYFAENGIKKLVFSPFGILSRE